MKKRIAVAAGVLAVSALALIPVLALDFHALLSRDMDLLTVSPVAGWKAFAGIHQVRMLYLFILAALGLSLVWALVSSSTLNYRSNMRRITPDISTPCADGQGQFGTARWLPKNQIGKAFTVRRLSQIGNLDELVKAGLQDREAVNDPKSI